MDGFPHPTLAYSSELATTETTSTFLSDDPFKSLIQYLASSLSLSLSLKYHNTFNGDIQIPESKKINHTYAAYSRNNSQLLLITWPQYWSLQITQNRVETPRHGHQTEQSLAMWILQNRCWKYDGFVLQWIPKLCASVLLWSVSCSDTFKS